MNAFYSLAMIACAAGQPQATERPSVLVLDDFKLLEGQVTQIEDYHDASGETKMYRVSSAGTLRTIPAKSVLFQGANRQGAYLFVKGMWNLKTADERIRLAEWCRDAGLIVEALSEAKVAAKLAPPDAYLVKLIHDLEVEKAKMPDERMVRIVRPAPPKPAAPTAAPPSKRPDRPALDPILEKVFGLKIQPILMNQCVSCHANLMKRTTFVLSRVPEGETAGATTTRNLMATMEQVNGEKPEQSPLLVYAATPHGMQRQACLTVRHPAYRNLSSWVAAASAVMLPQPQAPKSAPVATTATPSAGRSVPQSRTPPTATPAEPKIKITLGPNTVDPFDPAEFNKTTLPVKKR